MNIIENKTFDEERALYNSEDLKISHCCFDGPADGESAFKECRNIQAEQCFFNLRYPFWHDNKLKIDSCEMTTLCRAALWYSKDIEIINSVLHGIKALRECKNIFIKKCDIKSPEFGWSAENIRMEDSSAESEYFFMRSEHIIFNNVRFKGKYSFQYIKDAVFDNCYFDTKDAFWHSKNVLVRNCTVKGEYLAWYSESLTLEDCTIIGTQPLCYCSNLKLINCKMLNADLCFEKSEVEADITSIVISIKNPKSGTIKLPSVGEIILDDEEALGKIIIKTIK